MHLKALHIQGFKSFPDKTEIKFGTGLTAIVGPNGSGKSNISDAVRWVLGEQSTKTLRGAKMEDVIFGGTQKRAPVGFAEVSLIIDNTKQILKSDYSEIMITRRYFRSGDSEFYINKKSVRLRDIHELFMDTGLGRDGYSMIGQGKIDEILSVKSEDRREVFEEAAGITKFRYRKEEAEKKLNQTQENLIRVDDILDGVESRLEPLNVASQKAKKFLVLAEELKTLEVLTWIGQINGFKEKLDELTGKIDIFTSDIEIKAENREKLEIEQENLTTDLQQADISREQLQRDLNEVNNLQSDMKSHRAVLRESIKNTEQNYSNLMQDIDKGNERAKDVYDKIAEHNSQNDQILSEIKTAEQNKNELEQESKKLYAQKEQKSSELSFVYDEKVKLEDKIRKNEERKHTLTTMKNRDKLRLNELELQLAEREQKIQERTAQFDTLNAEISNLTDQKNTLVNQISGIEIKLRTRQNKSEELSKLKNKYTIDSGDLERKIKMLEDMDKHFDGYPKTVKIVMKQAENKLLKGVLGPVSTLIETDKDFITAVETALGAAASNIVTQTDKDAKNAIEYLKNTGGGRATFLALNVIRKSNFNYSEQVKNCIGFVGVCSDLVRYDEVYKDIVSSILGRTVIAETLTDAMNIAKQFSYAFRIVTLDGQVVNAGGSMTGGSSVKSMGSLSRQSERRELQVIFEQTQSKLAEINSDFDKISAEVSKLSFDVRTLTEEKAYIDTSVASKIATREQFVHLTQNIDEQNNRALDDIKSIKSELKIMNEEIYQINTEEDDEKDKLNEINEKFSNMSQGQEKLFEQIDTIKTQSLMLASEIDNLKAQILINNENIKEFEQIVFAMENEKTDKNEKLEQYLQERLKFEQELENTYTDMRQLEEKAETITVLIDKTRNHRMEIEAKRSKVIKQIGEISDIVVSLERNKNDLMSKKVSFEASSRSIHDKLWEKYELTPTVAAETFTDKKLPSNSEGKISELRSAIRTLGSVNVDAINEYEEVLEQFNFLTTQKQDIENAKADLLATISQLTENMKIIFKQQFKLLNEHFGKIFTDMFGGGFAELLLEDELDVLGCGIEIKVCPPGKILKTITLLSGGERAFVAIALYFAILKVRPAPFCFLDEIEAALDDANVIRFAKYMRKMTDNTQFIVITHRRGTMEESDILYGITMQQQGISKMLMLNVNEVEKELNIKV